MSWTNEQLDHIFERTSGKCHLCHVRVARKNYGVVGARGAWHVDHSVARARGGTDTLGNLLPAHIRCNCSKGAGTNRSTRARHGKRRAPLSRARRTQAKAVNGAIGAGLCAAIGGAVAGKPGAWIGGLIGAAIGSSVDPDNEADWF